MTTSASSATGLAGPSGRGLVPEAVREVLRHAFEDLGMRCVWAGYYYGNDKSRRVQEKCGFRYQ